MLRVGHFGTNPDATGVRVDHGRNGGNLSVELAIRKGEHLHFDFLADLEGRAVDFGHVREHPHGGDVGERKRRRRVAGLDIETWSGIAGGHAA